MSDIGPPFRVTLEPPSTVGSGTVDAALVAVDNPCPKIEINAPGASAVENDAPLTMESLPARVGSVSVSLSNSEPSGVIARITICGPSTSTRR